METSKLDPQTLKIIEAAFGGRLFLNHTEAAKLLQVDRVELLRMGDDGEICFKRKGSKRRRYRRTDITNYVARDFRDGESEEREEPSSKDRGPKPRSRLEIKLAEIRKKKDKRRLQKDAGLRKKNSTPIDNPPQEAT